MEVVSVVVGDTRLPFLSSTIKVRLEDVGLGFREELVEVKEQEEELLQTNRNYGGFCMCVSSLELLVGSNNKGNKDSFLFSLT